MDRKWNITSDSIKSSDGEEIKFTDQRAFPIYVTKRFGVLCGNNGNVHANIMKDDLDTLATMKAFKLISQVPDFLEEYMSDVDFSDCTLKYDKAKKCADAIKNDIYCDGRVFELEGETVILLWKELPDEIKNAIADSVCKDKYIENTNVVFASNKQEKPSPDSITIDGVTYGYDDKTSIPFILFRDKTDKMIFGKKGDIHALLLSRFKHEMLKQAIDLAAENGKQVDKITTRKYINKKVDEMAVVEGRFWDLRDVCDKIVFAFWTEYQPYNIKEVIENTCKRFNLDFGKAYCVRNEELLHVVDEDYIPTDSDYAGMETDFDYDEYQKELDLIHQNHNPLYIPGQGMESREDFESRKKEDTSCYRNDRDEEWAKKHMNDDGSVPTKAEWNFRTKMDENKNRRR